LEDVITLLKGVDINVLDEENRNLLQEAIAWERNDICVELIRREIDVNHKDPQGLTPVHFVALYRNASIARIILENQGRLDLEDEHENQPLWTAVVSAKGDYSVVALFMQNGADANHINKHGKSPVDFAKQLKNSKLFELLGQQAT